jgi:hypothetical protein
LCFRQDADANRASIAVPLHRAFAKIVGVLLGVDPWKVRPSLPDMDLDGTPVAAHKRMLGSR